MVGNKSGVVNTLGWSPCLTDSGGNGTCRYIRGWYGSEARLRVNENSRVVIPASFRKALGINVGDEVVLRIEDDELRITAAFPVGP